MKNINESVQRFYWFVLSHLNRAFNMYEPFLRRLLIENLLLIISLDSQIFMFMTALKIQ